MVSVVGTATHVSVGVTLFIFGFKILLNSIVKPRLWWKNTLEYQFLYIVGFLQAIAPLPLLFYPSLCGSSDACMQRNLIHFFAGLILIIGVSFSKLMHKFNKTDTMDFGIPFAGVMTGFFLYTHDHTMDETENVEMQIEMANMVLHEFASIMVVLSSCLRLTLDYTPKTELAYGLMIATAGTTFILTAPDCVDRQVRVLHLDGHVISFISTLLTLVLYTVGYAYIHTRNIETHTYQPTPTDSVPESV